METLLCVPRSPCAIYGGLAWFGVDQAAASCVFQPWICFWNPNWPSMWKYWFLLPLIMHTDAPLHAIPVYCCHLGWKGANCVIICPSGSHGFGCQRACECENGATCNPITGACTCLPGFAGMICNKTCPSGFYGAGCQLRCACQNGAACDNVYGNCTCLPGYKGLNH